MCTKQIPAACILALSVATGCGEPALPRSADPTRTEIAYHAVADYLPLLDNTVMSFETETEGSSEGGLLIMQVRRSRPTVVELNIGGKIRRLDLLKDGVKMIEGGWLLKAPLEVGATFPGLSGQVRIASISRSVDVPAGKFKECVETVEISPQVRTVTTFCPLVGIVLLEVDSMSVQSPEHVIARLKAHGPRVDLGGDRVQIRSE